MGTVDGAAGDLKPALKAVDTALIHLYNASGELASAARWGMADILAGGLLTSLVKHGKLETVREELEAAQRAVAGLARELEGVEGFTAFGPRLTRFDVVFDTLLDNPFTDIAVQFEIDEAQDRVDWACEQCELVRAALIDAGALGGRGPRRSLPR